MNYTLNTFSNVKKNIHKFEDYLERNELFKPKLETN